LQTAYLGPEGAAGAEDQTWRLLPGYLLGVVLKDDPKDRGRLLSYWDGAVKRRSEQSELWKQLHGLRAVLEE
jgi:hypothetical protein